MNICPLKGEDYSGNCESCNFKVDCMLKEILERLQNLEKALSCVKMIN
ncbi:MAG: hypothetical protein PHF74_08340 [Dehalococcoidales bacterium]|nr:hypothetical protein [Dehalococcoidales bacterium]